jgi:hypothetical protein
VNATNRAMIPARRSAIVLAAVAASLVFRFPADLRAQALNACDLNGDKVVDVLDVQLMARMTLGVAPCTANIAGAGVCSPAVYEIVKRAALTGICAPHSVSLSGTAPHSVSLAAPHSVSLAWTASTSPNIRGYNVYRSTVYSAYTKLTPTPVAETTFVDITVQAGQTYFYVATAVDSSNKESVYSKRVSALIPTP